MPRSAPGGLVCCPLNLWKLNRAHEQVVKQGVEVLYTSGFFFSNKPVKCAASLPWALDQIKPQAERIVFPRMPRGISYFLRAHLATVVGVSTPGKKRGGGIRRRRRCSGGVRPQENFLTRLVSVGMERAKSTGATSRSWWWRAAWEDDARYPGVDIPVVAKLALIGLHHPSLIQHFFLERNIYRTIERC